MGIKYYLRQKFILFLRSESKFDGQINEAVYKGSAVQKNNAEQKSDESSLGILDDINSCECALFLCISCVNVVFLDIIFL